MTHHLMLENWPIRIEEQQGLDCTTDLAATGTILMRGTYTHHNYSKYKIYYKFCGSHKCKRWTEPAKNIDAQSLAISLMHLFLRPSVISLVLTWSVCLSFAVPSSSYSFIYEFYKFEIAVHIVLLAITIASCPFVLSKCQQFQQTNN